MNLFTRLCAIGLFVAMSFSMQAQELDHILGDLLIQLRPDQKTENVAKDLATFEGVATELEFVKLISAPFDIYEVHFNYANVDENRFLAHVRDQDAVLVAQFNHLITERIIPDDPQFGSQWHWLNPGGAGADADADIDADEAWDLTTGGFTANGDRIVVCVIEGGGSNMNHPDLTDNRWVNQFEIPNNGMDDDSNGYIDDYEGWNPVQDNDNIPSGNHGTAVSGMIGATGNNGVGVTGINWDIEIMQVTVGGLSESNVVEAYTYPYVMRDLYNQTGGEEGAFVVATNASWGIDGGNPAGAPIWCNFYDDLGSIGILNCGATANNNVNIDVVGDLPTACPSPFMVAVTATNDNDVRTFSGYGIEQIDVGAPGEDVFLPSGSAGYSGTSGTSFASPCTAGVIALMYSAPCSDLADLALSNPETAAIQVREALYQGVDPIPNLADEVKYGGRINAFTSLNLVLASCGGCFLPSGVSVSDIEDNSAVANWNSSDSTAFDIQWKEVGTNDWMTAEDVTAPFTMDGLNACSRYEVVLTSVCLNDPDNPQTALSDFTTGCTCDQPANLDSLSVGITTGEFTWEPAVNASFYIVRYRQLTETEWTLAEVTDNSYFSDSLEACTNYRLQVRSDCELTESGFSTQFDFKTDCEETSNTNDLLAESSWSIYPTLVTNEVTVENRGGLLDAWTVQIMDVTGRVLEQSNHQTGYSWQSDQFNQWPSGVYFLRVQQGNRYLTQRLVKQ
ncbi:MAG: S8 family serine peptidase [Bacteroidota bacterium]